MIALSGLADGKLKDLTTLRQGPLARALEALNGGDEETRLVGGAVRDLALGEPAVDFDLTTTVRLAKSSAVREKRDSRSL
jgi:poly(A) polymerase